MSAERAARALTTITGAEWRVAGDSEFSHGKPVCDGNCEFDAMTDLLPTMKIALAVTTPHGGKQFVAEEYDVGILEARARKIHR